MFGLFKQLDDQGNHKPYCYTDADLNQYGVAMFVIGFSVWPLSNLLAVLFDKLCAF